MPQQSKNSAVFSWKLQKIAVALKYKYQEDTEPRVVATGSGQAADNILKKAQAHGVPVHEDKDLAHLLSKVEVGSPIPQELFEAVAEVIAMIYRIDQKYGKPGEGLL